jgi:hypothetical protein
MEASTIAVFGALNYSPLSFDKRMAHGRISSAPVGRDSRLKVTRAVDDPKNAQLVAGKPGR